MTGRPAGRAPYTATMQGRHDDPPPPSADDDAALFREAIGEVRRLDAAPPPPRRKPPPPRPRQREADESEALRDSRERPFDGTAAVRDESLAFRANGVSERTWRRLRRGQFAVQDELDLHHLDAPSAERLLHAFLNDCRQHGRLCVRVIHGKGLHSKSGEPVLKSRVATALSHRADVLACTTAPPAQGGGGAVLVLLKRLR